MSELRDEVYDWLAEEQRHQAAPLIKRAETGVNPVNGHGRGCECSQCPGWYDRRDALTPRELHTRAIHTRGGVAADRGRSAVLFDQIIPVCCLLAMVTVCGLVLLPVVVPLMAISAMMIVALAIVVVAGAVAVVYAVNAVKRSQRRTIRGEVERWR